MADSKEALELALQYNADLFTERTVKQMATHYLARPAPYQCSSAPNSGKARREGSANAQPTCPEDTLSL